MNIIIKLDNKNNQGIIKGGVVCYTDSLTSASPYFDTVLNQSFTYRIGLIADKGIYQHDIDILEGASISNPIQYNFAIVDETGDWKQLIKTSYNIAGQVSVIDIVPSFTTDIVSVDYKDGIVYFKTEDRRKYVTITESFSTDNKGIPINLKETQTDVYSHIENGTTKDVFNINYVLDYRLNSADGVKNIFNTTYSYNLSGFTQLLMTIPQDLITPGFDDEEVLLEIIAGPNQGKSYIGQMKLVLFTFTNTYLRYINIDPTKNPTFDWDGDNDIPNFSFNDTVRIRKNKFIYTIPTGVNVNDIDDIYVVKNGKNISLIDFYETDGTNIIINKPPRIKKSWFYQPKLLNFTDDSFGQILASGGQDLDNNTYSSFEVRSEQYGGGTVRYNFDQHRDDIISFDGAKMFLVIGYDQNGIIRNDMKAGFAMKINNIYQTDTNNKKIISYIHDASQSTSTFWNVPNTITNNSPFGRHALYGKEEEPFDTNLTTDDFDNIQEYTAYFTTETDAGFGYLGVRVYTIGLLIQIDDDLEDNEEIFIDLKTSTPGQDTEDILIEKLGISDYVSLAYTNNVRPMEFIQNLGVNKFPAAKNIAKTAANNYITFNIFNEPFERGLVAYPNYDLNETVSPAIFSETMVNKDSISEVRLIQGSFVNDPKIKWTDSIGKEYYIKFKFVTDLTKTFDISYDFSTDTYEHLKYVETNFDLTTYKAGINLDIKARLKTIFDNCRSSYISTGILVSKDIDIHTNTNLYDILNYGSDNKIFKYITIPKREFSFKSNMIAYPGTYVRFNNIAVFDNYWIYGIITSITYNLQSTEIEYTIQIESMSRNLDEPLIVDAELTYTSHIVNANDNINDRMLNYDDIDTYNGIL